ncbi:MAG: tetratricopeptide repeat protein [Isosphaeraceae bacterium]|nr:tetratricopeptide repeat protein [Isosphaeraceae bacterium]
MNGFGFGGVDGGPVPEVLAALGVVGLLLVLLAIALLAWADRQRRWPSLVLGMLGIVAGEYALNEVRTQTINHTAGEGLTNTVKRYPPALRDWTIPGMAALPALFGVAAGTLWSFRNRRLHEEVPERYKEGVQHYYQRNYEAALIDLTAALKIEPQRADVLCMRGAVFARLGAYEMAIADLDRALTHAPGLLDAYLHRGRVRAARGEYDLALADFDRFLDVRHHDAECLLERGRCLERKGLVLEAVAVFEKVLRLTNHPDLAFPATERLRALGANGPAWPQAAPSTP